MTLRFLYVKGCSGLWCGTSGTLRDDRPTVVTIGAVEINLTTNFNDAVFRKIIKKTYIILFFFFQKSIMKMVTFTWCATAKTGSSLMVPSNVKVDHHYNWQKRKLYFGKKKHKFFFSSRKRVRFNLNYSLGIQIKVPYLQD